jgi:choline-sulfatase
MYRRQFLVAAAAGAAALAAGPGRAAPGNASTQPDAPPPAGKGPAGPPNLLFLFADEHRADALGAYGNNRIQTPNLDGLARRATVFERAYATQPVCTPSRASLLAGLWPHTSGCTQNNLPLPAATPTLAEMLPAGRYATGYFGKWHLGDEVFAQHGFQEWRSIEDIYQPYYGPGRDPKALSSYYHFLVDHGQKPKGDKPFSRGEAARLPEALGKPAYLAGEASDFIRRHRAGPWCLYVCFLEPHMPYTGPRDGQYDPAQVTLPANFNNPPAEDQPQKTRQLARSLAERGFESFKLQTDDQWRRLIANYWGSCSLVDTHAGTILRTLEDCGLADRTIVVYTSDHGDMMGSHRMLAKSVMFEEAERVPLIVRLPGQREGRRIRGPTSTIDLVPTLLDLVGAPVPERLQGTSLRPQLEGKSDATGRDVFVEWNGGGKKAAADAVRSIVTTDGWKFNCNVGGDHELYNLNEDPIEVYNLAFRSEMQPKTGELLVRIRAWQKRTGDTVTLPDPPYARQREESR